MQESDVGAGLPPAQAEVERMYDQPRWERMSTDQRRDTDLASLPEMGEAPRRPPRRTNVARPES